MGDSLPDRRQVTVRAPVRVDFAGGGSDVPPFATDEWGYVVNGAIDRYATVTVARRDDGAVVLASEDLGVREVYPSRAALPDHTPLRLLAGAVRMVGGTGGLEVHVRTDVPAGSGLGASAAVSVALLYALQVLDGTAAPDRAAVAEAAIRLETGGLKNTGGGQDQFAAAFGGLQGLRFAGGHVTRRALRLAPATLAALNGGLLLCYSGTAHVSGALLAELVRRYQAGDPATLAHLRRLRELAGQVEAVLEGAALGRLGPLLTANWQAFRSFHPTIATPAIETIFRLARAAGATGGKATGAGGGGCVLLACEPTDRERVAGALQTAGFLLIPFQFEGEGVTVVDAPPLAPP